MALRKRSLYALLLGVSAFPHGTGLASAAAVHPSVFHGVATIIEEKNQAAPTFREAIFRFSPSSSRLLVAGLASFDLPNQTASWDASGVLEHPTLKNAVHSLRWEQSTPLFESMEVVFLPDILLAGLEQTTLGPYRLQINAFGERGQKIFTANLYDQAQLAEGAMSPPLVSAFIRELRAKWVSLRAGDRCEYLLLDPRQSTH